MPARARCLGLAVGMQASMLTDWPVLWCVSPGTSGVDLGYRTDLPGMEGQMAPGQAPCSRTAGS